MMSQHSELVERRRKVLNAEIWAKKTASIQMIASKDGNKTWTTTYNDGSVSTEYWDRDGFKDKEALTSPTLNIDDCIQQMGREEADARL